MQKERGPRTKFARTGLVVARPGSNAQRSRERSVTKATSLASEVTLSLSPDVPLMVEYDLEAIGFVRFYLAPKLEGDN